MRAKMYKLLCVIFSFFRYIVQRLVVGRIKHAGNDSKSSGNSDNKED